MEVLKVQLVRDQMSTQGMHPVNFVFLLLISIFRF